MDGNAGMIGDGFRQRRARIANEIDVDAGRRERVGVVLHPGTSSEVPYDNDGSAHF